MLAFVFTNILLNAEVAYADGPVLEKHAYYYGQPQPYGANYYYPQQYYGYQNPYQQYHHPQWNQQQQNNYRPQQQQSQQHNSCNGGGFSNAMSLLDKLTDTTKEVETLAKNFGHMIKEFMSEPIMGVIEIPETVLSGVKTALSMADDLGNAVHMVRCSGPQFHNQIVKNVRNLDSNKNTLLSVSGNFLKNFGGVMGIGHMIATLEHLVESTVKNILFQLPSEHNAQVSPQASSSDAFADFSDYGSSSTATSDPYAQFSDVPEATTTTEPVNSPTPGVGATCNGNSVFETVTAYTFTKTHPSNTFSVFTFTTTASFTFSNELVKRDVSDIDQGVDSTAYETRYVPTYAQISTMAIPEPTGVSFTGFQPYSGTQGVFMHPSISMVQHMPNNTITATRSKHVHTTTSI